MERYQGDLGEDLLVVATNKLAEEITGGLSHPSKMPEAAWGISTSRCQMGSILAGQENTVCGRCYARKGRYRFSNVQEKLETRFQGLEHKLWVPAMVLLIRWEVGAHMRWFDSGDLTETNLLYNICRVAEHTPHIRHWLPTQEHQLVREFAEEEDIPENLIIRLSGRHIDGTPPPNWPTTSTVYTQTPQPETFVCQASTRKNRCGECRSCWDKSVSVIAYPLK